MKKTLIALLLAPTLALGQTVQFDNDLNETVTATDRLLAYDASQTATGYYPVSDLTAYLATLYLGISANAGTATALAANPSDCAANQFATTIAANGNLTCAAIAAADLPSTGTWDASGLTLTLPTATFTSTLTLDDGTTDSPSIVFTDATDETSTILKTDGAYTTWTTVAADGVNFLTGNVKIGNGTPGQTIDGEDLYVEGLVEIDSLIYPDGGIKKNVVVTTDGALSVSAAQMYGTFFVADNATATNDTDYTLPTAVAGMSACFYDNGAGTGGIIIDANTGDEILLDGTGVGAADAIDSPGVGGDGANGDTICILAIDDTNWVTLNRSGTWVDGGAD